MRFLQTIFSKVSNLKYSQKEKCIYPEAMEATKVIFQIN